MSAPNWRVALVTRMVESEVEEATLDWLASIGWTIRNAEIAPGGLFAPRQSCDDAPEGT